jgi:hypothetical protein
MNYSHFTRKTSIVLLLAMVLLMSVSCKKENFNFSRITNVEFNPDYGLPIGTVRYNIAEILTQLDKEGYVQQEANGDLFYSYLFSKDTVIFGGDIMKYNATAGTFGPFAEDIPAPGEITVSVPFDFPVALHDSTLILSSVEVKSGTVKLILNSTAPGTIEFTMPTVTKNGVPFSQELILNGDNQEIQIDLAGFRLQESEEPNTFPCQGTATFTVNPSITNYSLEGSYSTSEIKLKSFEGRMDTKKYNMVENFNFDLLSMLSLSNYGVSSITLYDPSITLSIGNTFNFEGQFQLEQLMLSSADNSLSTPLLSAPSAPYTIFYSPTMIDYSLDEVLSQIPIRPEYNTIRVAGNSTLNPGGYSTPISMDDNSKISVKVKVVIPFKLKVENAYFRDTLQFNLSNMTGDESDATLQMINTIENLSLNITLSNTIPVGFRVQALACDSTGRIVDSLFTETQLLEACFNPASPRKTELPVSMNYERANRLLKSKQLILRFQMDTGGQIATFNNAQYLQATLRGRIKCNLGEIDFSFLSNLFVK